MPRKRGETERQYMDRIRAFRGLPPMVDGDRLMERTRAAVAFCNTTQDEGTNVHAFMALFHPEVDDATVRELARDARSQRRR